VYENRYTTVSCIRERRWHRRRLYACVFSRPY